MAIRMEYFPQQPWLYESSRSLLCLLCSAGWAMNGPSTDGGKDELDAISFPCRGPISAPVGS